MTVSPFASEARERKRAEADAVGIDDPLIASLVDAFYARVRDDDMLGPIFAAHVADWGHHLPKMKNFWASIMIESGRFNGSPMQKHIAMGILTKDHFDHWLTLWDRVVDEIVPNPEAAARFHSSAHRIADSLLTGVLVQRGGLSALSKTAPKKTAPAQPEDHQ